MRVMKNYQAPAPDPCVSAGTFGQVEDYTLNISESLASNGFEKDVFILYPNPTNSNSYIISDKEINAIRIFNQIGQLVRMQKERVINCSSFAKGLYIISAVFTDGLVVTQKIIVE